MGELQPGREMDAAVAIAACGWKWMAYDYGIQSGGTYIALYSPGEMEERAVWEPDCVYEREEAWDATLPCYSTSDADAFTALDAWLDKHPAKIIAEVRFPLTHLDPDHLCNVRLVSAGQGLIHNVYAATRAEAICRAILAQAAHDA